MKNEDAVVPDFGADRQKKDKRYAAPTYPKETIRALIEKNNITLLFKNLTMEKANAPEHHIIDDLKLRARRKKDG